MKEKNGMKKLKPGYKLFIKPNGVKNIIIPVKGVVYTLIITAQFLFPGMIIDALYPNVWTEKAITYIAVLLGIALVGNIVQRWLDNSIEMTNYKANARIKKELNEGLLTVDYKLMESTEFHNRLSFAQKCIDRNFYLKFSNLVVTLVSLMLIFFSAGNLFRQKEAIIFVVVFSLLNIIVGFKCKSVMYRNRFREQQENNTEQRELEMSQWDMVDIKYGKEVRLFNLSDYMTRRYNDARNRIYQMRLNCSKQNVFWSLFPTLLYGIEVGSVYLFISIRLTQGVISAGEFTVYAGAFLSIFGIITTLVERLIDISSEGKYLEQLQDMLEEIGVSEECSTEPVSSACDFRTIEFRNVSYQYAGRMDWALRNVNFQLRAGEKISIVGCNGSGKTTFIKLLLGLYKPTEGEILVNGINVENWKQDELRRLFSPVFQDYGVFGYTLADNMTMSEQVDMERLGKAMSKAGIQDKINTLAAGANSYLGKKICPEGLDMSGGELQKLAMARAFYKDAPIIILDEPTAALSPRAEYELYQSVWNSSNDKTILFISHRLSSCKESERILTFDAGELIEAGTHEELMEAHGKYYELFSSQAENYTKGEPELV